MTIDERLEKLAERHDALVLSVELLLASQKETDRRFKETDGRFKETDRQFRDMQRETDRRFRDLAEMLDETRGFINSLAEVALKHQQRLDALDRSK